MERNFYARYNKYGIQYGGMMEYVHIFSDKKTRDKWVDICNGKSEERGAVTAEPITAKQAYKLIKDYDRQYVHKDGRVYY